MAIADCAGGPVPNEYGPIMRKPGQVSNQPARFPWERSSQMRTRRRAHTASAMRVADLSQQALSRSRQESVAQSLSLSPLTKTDPRTETTLTISAPQKADPRLST